MKHQLSCVTINYRLYARSSDNRCSIYNPKFNEARDYGVAVASAGQYAN